jgi:hypothetical protein
MIWLIFIILWLATGFLFAGLNYGYFWNKYDDLRRGDSWDDTVRWRRDSWLTLVMGPFSIIAAFMIWRPFTWKKWWGPR